MIKYEFDEDKKERLLKFWSVETIEQYEKKILDWKFILKGYFQLSKKCRESLAQLIFFSLSKKIITQDNLQIDFPKKKTSVFSNDLEIESSTVDLLDDYNFISQTRNRSNLNKRKDEYIITAQTQKLFKKVVFFSNQLENPFNLDKLLPWKDISTKDEHEIFSNYFFAVNSFETWKKANATTAQLPHCLGVDIEGQLSFYLANTDYQPELLEELDKYGYIEKPALLIYKLSQLLYFQLTKKKKMDETIEPRIANFFLPVFKKWNREKKIAFLRKNLKQKIKFLILNTLPILTKIIPILQHILPDDAIYPLSLVKRNLNEWLWKKKSKNIAPEKINLILQWLMNLEILQKISDKEKKGDWVIFSREIYQYFKRYSETKLSSPVMIDSDMQVTIYRNQLNINLYYTLLFISKIEPSQYMLVAQLDPEKSYFADVNGIHKERIIKTLKKHAGEYFNSEVEEYIIGMYQKSKVFKLDRPYMIYSSSLFHHNQAKNILVKNSISFDEFQSESEGLIILIHYKKHYNKVVLLLEEKKYMLI